MTEAGDDRSDAVTPLSADDMRRFLDTLGEELGDGNQIDLMLTGGAYLALTNRRESTYDIDSAFRLSADVSAASIRAAQRCGLPRDTLNDAAAMWTSALQLTNARLLHRAGRLAAYGPTDDDIVLLKLRAGRPRRDDLDVVLLLPHTSFRSIAEIIDRFWAAFPEEPADEHLADYVAKLAARADYPLPMNSST